MSSTQKRPLPSLISVVSLSIASWFVLVPMVNSIKLPFGDRYNDIISAASVKNISPYTDYLKFFTLLLIPALVAAIILTLKHQFFDRVISILTSKLSQILLFKAIVPVLLGYWIIYNGFIDAKNWGVPDWGSPVTDTFHEGEFLGLLPNFLDQEKPFLNTFFIHGFGLDALPSILAHQLAWQDNVIALTRFFYLCESAIAVFTCLWILWEIVGSVQLKVDRTKVFIISAILYCFIANILFKVYGGRDALFLIQIALTLRFFRLTVNRDRFPKARVLFLSFLVGISLPIGFLHTYDRAAYFIVVYLCVSVLSIALGKQVLIFWMGGSAIGLTLSSGLIVSILGWDQFSEILGQVSYWSKYGKYLAFLPFSSIELTYVSFLDWWPILFLSSVLVYLVWDYASRNFSPSFWTDNALTIILLVASLTYMRILIDRSPGMGVFAALPASFLFAYLLLKTYNYHVENRGFNLAKKTSLQCLLTLSLVGIIIAEPGFNIFEGTRQIGKLYQSLWVSDAELLVEGYQEAFNELQPEVDRQSCFYTLTSEGLWYYLFDKPSCSKINYTYYVRPKKMQESVVRELQDRHPNIVLLTNAMWSNKIDGIPIADSASLIYQYIITHYEPYRLIASHWFWKKRDKPITFVPQKLTSVGNIDTLCSSPEKCEALNESSQLKIKAKHNNLLKGFALSPQQNRPADAVYLSYGKDDQLIAVTSVQSDTHWELPIPAKSLPRERGIFKVWGYDSSQGKLMQIGSDLQFKIQD